MALKIGSTSVSKMYKGSIEVTKGYLGSSLIYSIAAPSTALTNSNFSTARNLWFTDQAQAEATYGLIGDWNTTAVTNMKDAFFAQGVVSNTFNEDISNWDVSNVTNMENIFRSQSIFNQNIGGWNTGNVTNMSIAFSSTGLFNQNIGGWNTSSVTNISDIFSNSQSFNQPIGSWDVSNVTSLFGSFYNASAFNQDINAWNVSNVTTFHWAFKLANNFNQNIGGLDVSNASTIAQILNSTNLSTSNYNLILIGWEADLQSKFPNGAGYSKTPSAGFGGTRYTIGGLAASARASLISNFGWTITDGGGI
jgi:surface protein